MKIQRTLLDGLLIIHPQVFGDSRGYFFESFNDRDFRKAGLNYDWKQDNHSASVKNCLRGLHFQKGRGQAKVVRCTAGAIWDVAVDLRKDSSTFGQWCAEDLTAENKKMMLVPEGFAHGYVAMSDHAECLYKCDRIYDPELESGIAWNDPDIGINWPCTDPLLSARDQANQSFQEFLATLGE